MPFIDAQGRITQRPSPFQQLLHALHSIWLALALFFTTLLNARLQPPKPRRDLC